MKPKGWSASQVSQTITNMTKNGHIRLTSGKTSEFYFRKILLHQKLRRKISGRVLGERFLRFNDVGRKMPSRIGTLNIQVHAISKLIRYLVGYLFKNHSNYYSYNRE